MNNLLARALEQLRGRLFPVPPGARVHSLRGAAAALFLCLSRQKEGPFAAAFETEEKALGVYRDMRFFCRLLGMGEDAFFFLPDPDGPEAAGKRAAFQFGLARALRSGQKARSVIASMAALSAPLWPLEVIGDIAINLACPGEFARQELEGRLIGMGYVSQPIVTMPGEFRLKGWILDVFPAGADEPVRVEFFGDEVETIRALDVESQMSASDVKQGVLLLPAAEPKEGKPFEFDRYDRLFAGEKRGGLPERACLVSAYPIKGRQPGDVDAGVSSLAGHGILHGERRDITELPPAIKRIRQLGDVLLVMSSAGQAERLKEILWQEGIQAPVLEPHEALSHEGGLSIALGNLSAGFRLEGLFVITGRDVFGERPAWKPMGRSKLSGLVHALDDLRAGDYVVHRDHGIGRFLGIIRQTLDGYAADFILIEYARGDKVYLPLYGIEKIHKYKTPEGAAPELDRLGGKAWERKKQRVKKRLKEMAGKLLRIYAERKVATGIAFSPDTELHREFDSFFPYEETPDQIKAAAEIKRDMESERPMERLLCGDVGYGKTEVAMKAAFKALYDGRQTVVLVPTTLLCEQHMRTFSQRFSGFPVRIDYVSRFKSASEKKKTLEAFGRGEIDILIATHALLRADVSLDNLGLLIIDEEHRFGVAHKERIKELKGSVDVLLMTATPIPRTLQMALSGIRDMSVIETPPEERLAVKGTVAVFSKTLIQEAIRKELSRGGQVFFVHNRIEQMGGIIGLLRGVVPEARIGVAHGRIRERQLEATMLEFMNGQLDVLLSTAIIGSGLDIPNANTIIINRADMMGLADLYQIKGRVGRGAVKSYAWFLVPGLDVITDEAKKRLQALEELGYLGAGFRVAMKDLEIRGAGNLLGGEQSGYISDLGFDMYLELLERAVAELKGEEIKERVAPAVELRVDALIPEGYIEDVSLRLSFYRRVASARGADSLAAIAGELEERFGPLPAETRSLLRVMSLRLASESANVARITQLNGTVRFYMRPETVPPVEKLLRSFGRRLRFIPEGFEISLSRDDILRDISWVLGHLTGKGDFVIL